MQADVPVVHGQKRDRQHQRNGDAHHQARPYVDVITAPKRLNTRAFVKAQGDEAHRQHNHHRLNENAHKFIDRLGHSLGLVLQLHQLDASWQVFFNLCKCGFQRLAQGNDVAPLGHGHAQRNHLLPLVAHLDLRRVDVVALDGGNVAQFELRTIGRANRHQCQLLWRGKLPAHAHLHRIQRCLQNTSTLHGVLLPQLSQYLAEIKTQLRQTFL